MYLLISDCLPDSRGYRATCIADAISALHRVIHIAALDSPSRASKATTAVSSAKIISTIRHKLSDDALAH
jgi:hypothetical protein